MFTLKQDLSCPRRMTVYAIFDILDRLKSSYDQVMTGDIQAQVFVFGKECLCAFAVTESSLDTSILHITLLQPISDMTRRTSNSSSSISWNIFFFILMKFWYTENHFCPAFDNTTCLTVPQISTPADRPLPVPGSPRYGLSKVLQKHA